MISASTSKPSLKLEKIVGSGAFGTVYRGRYNSRKAAIKKFRLSQCTMSQEDIDNEIRLLQSLQFRHIIQFYGVVRQQDEILLVTDFAECGSLKRAIDKNQLTTWAEKERIAQEIADGLTYIHHEGILHRDLKSANVLLTGLMEVKLCDFGLAIVTHAHTMHTRHGTIRWMAPELLTDPPQYSTKSDVYALGMVMWEMAAMCTAPFKAILDNSVVAEAVLDGRREELPDGTPKEYRRWVEHCWHQNPSERLEADGMTLGDDTRSTRWSTMTNGLSVTDTMDPSIRLWHARDSLIKEGAPSQPMGHPPPTTPPCSPVSMTSATDREHRDLVHVSRMANCNIVDAQVYLADMYVSGKNGIDKDEKEAFTWYLRAAELGHTGAMRRVGDMYSEGRGTTQNSNEAEKWYRKAALQDQLQQQLQDQESGHAAGWQEALPSSPRGSSKGLSWFRSAKQKSLAAAGLKIIAMPATARVVEQEFAAASPRTGSTTTAESIHSTDTSEFSDEKSTARSSEISGEEDRWSSKAVNENHPTTQFNLGMTYAEGRGVERDDAEAVRWFTKAAEQGHPDAQFRLGLMYKNGRGVAQSDVQAVKWFTEGANQGDPDSQFSLGTMYEKGRGVKKSDVEAVKWFYKAALQEHPASQFNLGIMFKTGRGVKKSDVEAGRWLGKAASHDDTFS
ncbi:hypothetical protein BGZ73_008818 [Actinomortierella ambigua]|nr:hypothetical protein BGZ73_008818 [Actinomortierella ambigua]